MADPAVPSQTGVAEAPARRPALARRAAAAFLPAEPLPAGPWGVAPRVVGAGPLSRPMGVIQRARLGLAGLPLSRRIRVQRTRLEAMLAGSAVLHSIILALVAMLYARQGPPPAPQDQSPVQMVFGQSGMVGDTVSPDFAGGTPPTKQTPPPAQQAPTPVPSPAPTASQEPAVNPEVPPALPPVPIPDLTPLLPQPPQPPETRPQQRMQSPPMRVPLDVRPPTPSRRTARTSPFSNPMDLSFSEAPGPTRPRRGRASGSHAPVDLSLGPLVKNGHLNTPFATVGIKGVSDDYGSEIDAWIRRHLYYPPDAAERGEDGASHVHVVIDRSGHVKSVQLVDSSGSYALDGATEGMFRAATLPPVPPDMSGDHFDIDLTVNYILLRH